MDDLIRVHTARWDGGVDEEWDEEWDEEEGKLGELTWLDAGEIARCSEMVAQAIVRQGREKEVISTDQWQRAGLQEVGVWEARKQMLTGSIKRLVKDLFIDENKLLRSIKKLVDAEVAEVRSLVGEGAKVAGAEGEVHTGDGQKLDLQRAARAATAEVEEEAARGAAQAEVSLAAAKKLSAVCGEGAEEELSAVCDEDAEEETPRTAVAEEKAWRAATTEEEATRASTDEEEAARAATAEVEEEAARGMAETEARGDDSYGFKAIGATLTQLAARIAMTEEEEARAAIRAQEARVGSVEQSLGKASAVFEMVAGRVEQLQTRLKRHDAEMAAVKRQHEEAMRQRYKVS